MKASTIDSMMRKARLGSADLAKVAGVKFWVISDMRLMSRSAFPSSNRERWFQRWLAVYLLIWAIDEATNRSFFGEKL